MKVRGPAPTACGPTWTARTFIPYVVLALTLRRFERAGLVPQRGSTKLAEQRVRPQRPGLELGVELHRHEPGVGGQLRDLHELAVGRPAGHAQSLLGQLVLVQAVELEAVAVALADRGCRRRSARLRAGRQLAGVAARAASSRPARRRPAGPAACRSPCAARSRRPRWSRRPRGRRRCGRTHGGPLEAVADAEVRHAVLRAYSAAAIMPPVPREPKPPGTRMPSTPASRSRAALALQLLGLDPVQRDLGALGEAAVGERLVQALVGVLEADVLADDWIVTSRVGFLMRSTSSSHAAVRASVSGRPSCLSTIASRPSPVSTSGTS